ncbi:Uncharacterised protein [Paenibacillus polymyxa]|uniref:hypothetical protein n=1 Tax=Paenibacillus polymyxa TaxID=1406 RepID=UPI000D8BA248|nr:hypothetical protein [Paenibacillus polymyxa]SPY16086.1 Uncharacterised protein [Paenibacillus polymyxa]
MSDKMIESNPKEIVHLFEIINQFGSTCSLEFQVEGQADPLMGIVDEKIVLELYGGDGNGAAIVLELGDTTFSFEIEKHRFSKNITESQFIMCIVGKGYAVWFNSGVIPAEGVLMANQ